METKKISETSIEITKEVITPTKIIVNNYDRGFIENQIKDITAQRDSLIAIKEIELKECNDILKEMDKLGIKSKPIEPIEEQKPIEGGI